MKEGGGQNLWEERFQKTEKSGVQRLILPTKMNASFRENNNDIKLKLLLKFE